MAPPSVETFMTGVLADEGWMSPLDGDSVALAIARLEAHLPEGSELSDARADQLKSGLRELAQLVTALNAGTLTEAKLVDGVLKLLERTP